VVEQAGHRGRRGGLGVPYAPKCGEMDVPQSITWLAWACLSQCGETSETFFRPALLAVAFVIRCRVFHLGVQLEPKPAIVRTANSRGFADPSGPPYSYS
jgi:hypothetical protein